LGERAQHLQIFVTLVEVGQQTREAEVEGAVTCPWMGDLVKAVEVAD
jgi:hypothetical protein